MTCTAQLIRIEALPDHLENMVQQTHTEVQSPDGQLSIIFLSFIG